MKISFIYFLVLFLNILNTYMALPDKITVKLKRFRSSIYNKTVVISSNNHYTEKEMKCGEKDQFYYENDCYYPWVNGPCSDDEVLHIMDIELPIKLKCSKDTCPENEIWWPFTKKCEALHDLMSKYCNDIFGKIHIDYNGDVICICTKQFIQKTPGCHAFYYKGPCKDGEVITYDPNSGDGKCTPDLCYEQNSKMDKNIFNRPYAPLEDTGECLQLYTTYNKTCIVSIKKPDYIPKCTISLGRITVGRLLCITDGLNNCKKSANIQSLEESSLLGSKRKY